MKRGLLVLLLMTSCGRVSIDREACSLKRTLSCRTGYEFAWCGLCPDEVEAALAEPISREEAVEITLSNNPGLHGELESLGVAKSDLVQAGLLTNPVLNLDWRLPRGQSSIEGNLLYALTDLWQVPLRKRIASRHLEMTSYRILGALQSKIAEAKRAYDQRLFAVATLGVGRQILKDLETIYDLEVYRQQFGLDNDLDVALSLATAGEQKAMIADLERMEKMSGVELRLVLGLDTRFRAVDVGGKLSPPTDDLPGMETLIQRALSCQPDLLKMRAEVAHAKAFLRLEQWRVFRVVDGGVAVVKDPGEPAGFGPSVAIQLPVFDQNQAQITRARFQLAAACRRLQQRENEVVTELKQAATRYQTAREQLSLYREAILPPMERAFAFTQVYSKSYQIDVVKRIQAAKMLAHASLANLRYMLDARLALTDIEELIGVSLTSCPPSSAPEDLSRASACLP